ERTRACPQIRPLPRGDSSMRVFVTGGTGLVGTRLVRRLLQRQDQVVVLTRRPDTARQKWDASCQVVEGDPMKEGAWMKAVEDCDAVVNLAGEGLFNRRWRAAFIDLLRTSRVLSTQHVVKALGSQPR